MGKKVLILGANGAIGRYLVEYFLSECADIQLFTADLVESDFLKERSIFYKMDIGKENSFDQLPKDIYCIIDLATTMPARMIGFDPRLYIDTNIRGTINVLEFCKNNNVDRLLFAQTFGDILLKAEKDPLLKVDMAPEIDYSDSKSVYITTMNTCVELIKCYHSLFNIKSFIFRLPTIYSWTSKRYCENGVKTKQMWHILIEQAIAGEDIYVWGDPTRVKDMVYVKDLCQMFFKAVFVERSFGFYNVGTGVGISLLDQIKGIIDVFGKTKKSNILYAPDKPNAPQYIMCIDEAKKELGYEPKYDYITMLKDIKLEKERNRF